MSNLSISNSNNKALPIYFWFLFLTSFCEFQLEVGGNALKYVHYIILGCFFIKNINQARNMKGYTCLLLLSIFLNCASSYIFRSQGFLTTLLAYYQIWYLFYFYLLISYRPNLECIDKVIRWIIITVLIIYYIQLSIFPKIIWGNAGDEWVADNELYFRGLVVGGESAISLGYLYFMNKFLIGKNKIQLLFALVCAVPFFIRGYRIMILGAVISTFILYLKVKNDSNYIKLFIQSALFFAIICIFVVVLYYQVPLIQSSFEAIMYRAVESNQTFDNEDYIRMRSITYYYNDFFKSPIELFLGAGMIGSTGPVAKIFENLMVFNYNLTDWGLIGLSWYAGIPVVLCIVFYLIKGIREKVPLEYSYINSWFLYLLIISLTDPEMYQHYSFLIQSIMLYVLYLFNPNFLKLKI